MLPLPAPFQQHIAQVFGAEGQAWLAALPQLLDTYARRWDLRLLPPVANLTYNYVAPALLADGTGAVLKLGLPRPELLSEAAALRHYAGAGAARLLADDAAHGALLLERLSPGESLVALSRSDDAQATQIAAEVMRALWRPLPPDHAFPTVADWARELDDLRATFGGGTGPFPSRLVAQAEALFAELLASSGPPLLLHGDLHHDNMLNAGPRGWLAIDPKGLAGEPAYEIGALLRNPFGEILRWPQPVRLMQRRIDQLAETLELDRARVWGWGLAQTVLSAWWDYDAARGSGGEQTIAVAELIAATRP